MSASGAWGPAPPGVDLTEHQNGSIIGSVVAIMALGLSAVVLRVFIRLSHSGPGLAEDDYMILVAAVLGIGTAVCCLVSVPWGGGKHLWVVSFDEFTKLYQTTYAFVIVYIWCISATKTSILLFYKRVFGKGIIWNIVFVLTICHGLEVSITWLSGCRPVSYYWRQYTDPTAVGSCIDAPLFYFINGIIGLFIDVSILLVPVPTIIKLQMPPTKKIFIGGILLLGGFVCIASAVRIVMMDQLVKSADFTWAMSKVFIWSCCEPFIGIVCACLPTYAPLVRRWYSRRQGGGGAGGRRRRRGGGGGGGAGGAGDGEPGSDKGYYYPYYHQGSGSGGRILDTPPPPPPSVPQPLGYISDKPGRREWSRGLHGLGDTTLRGDDEIELTVDIRSGMVPGGEVVREKGGNGEVLGYRNEILVRKDFSWVSSA